MSNCKHGFGQGECTYCKEKKEINDAYLEPQLISMIDNIEQYGLVLSRPDMYGMINVMWLRARNHFEEINKEYADTQYVKQLSTPGQSRLKKDFRNIAVNKGSLFIPRFPLTKRETTESGESNCWSCGKGTKLSYYRGSIGCGRCKAYVCLCGHCMCDFPGGMCIVGTYIPERKHSPFNYETRREYVKIVKAFSSLN